MWKRELVRSLNTHPRDWTGLISRTDFSLLLQHVVDLQYKAFLCEFFFIVVFFPPVFIQSAANFKASEKENKIKEKLRFNFQSN